MNIRNIIALLLAFLLVLNCCSPGPSAEDERIAKLHDEALVWDCHNDLVLRVVYEKLDIGKHLPYGHVDIPSLREEVSMFRPSPFSSITSFTRISAPAKRAD